MVSFMHGGQQGVRSPQLREAYSATNINRLCSLPGKYAHHTDDEGDMNMFSGTSPCLHAIMPCLMADEQHLGCKANPHGNMLSRLKR